MVPTDNVGHILAIYGDFVEVFGKTMEETLPLHRSTGSVIDLEPGYNMPYGQIYNPSEFGLRTLKAYIEANLANGLSQRPSTPAAQSHRVAKKTDGGLRHLVDDCALNKATVKNRYLLLLISEKLDCLREARMFSTLDLCGAYNLIRIRRGDEFNTAFRPHYGQFEYRVMPFGLTHAPATFQSSIDDCLWPYIDDLTVRYLHGTLIYSTNEMEHEPHVRQVVYQPTEFGLYCNAEMCQFELSEVGFMGCIITPDGLGMESDRICTIEDCPTPTSNRNGQVLLRFTNFYQRSIRKFAKVSCPLTELLKIVDMAGEPPEGRPRCQKSENRGTVKWEWTQQAEMAFRKLQRTFTEAPILQHFTPAKPIILQTDPSGSAICGSVNQNESVMVLKSVNVYSRKCSLA